MSRMEQRDQTQPNALCESHESLARLPHWQEYFDTLLYRVEREYESGNYRSIGDAIMRTCVQLNKRGLYEGDGIDE